MSVTRSPLPVPPSRDGTPQQATPWFHYELPPEFFKLFLDADTMSYTCAYYNSAAETLAQAQRRKVELTLKKLQLEPGHRLLDIGCGWGNMVLPAAERGCRVTGLTLGHAQADYIRGEAARRGVGDRVEILIHEAPPLPFADASFDRVVTVEATEHIEDLKSLFAEVSRVLSDDGVLLQHAMTAPLEPIVPSAEEYFMRTYMLPVGRLKTLYDYVEAFELAGLELVDVHDITDHYPLTLYGWLENLERAGEAAAIETGVTRRDYNIERLFLAGCIGAFAESHIYCYQELLRKVSPGGRRRPIPAGRELYELEGEPSLPLISPILERPVVALEVSGVPMLWVEGGGEITAGEPPRNPDCRLVVDGDTLARLSDGRLSIVDAFVDGEVRAEGDLVAAVQVRSSLLSLASGSA